MLDGEVDHGWILKSPSLGENLKDMQHFLQDTSTQIGLPTLDYTVAVSSEVNGINLITGCPKRVVYLFSVGLRLAIDSLMSGLQEQVNIGSFDRDLAQSTFGFTDTILLQLMKE
jgi:hypothetical protein